MTEEKAFGSGVNIEMAPFVPTKETPLQDNLASGYLMVKAFFPDVVNSGHELITT